MLADEELRLASGKGSNGVTIPDLVEEILAHGGRYSVRWTID
jgi:hypothetical protein